MSIKIRSKDFDIIKTEFKIENLTTRTHFKNQPIEIIELGEHSLVISGPPNSCARGHHLSVEISSRLSEVTVTVQLTGAVIKQEALPGGFDQIELRLLQYDSKEWSLLTDLFSKRQSHLQNIFKKIKGLDD